MSKSDSSDILPSRLLDPYERANDRSLRLVTSLQSESKAKGKEKSVSLRQAMWQAYKAEDILEGRTSVGRVLSGDEIAAFMRKRDER